MREYRSMHFQTRGEGERTKARSWVLGMNTQIYIMMMNEPSVK
jgi:hypothetical protein